MALPYYMTMEGEKTGKIDFSPVFADKEGAVCHAFDQSIKIPFDSKTGKAAGLRIHGPITITKSFDKGSPLLYQMLCTGEKAKEVSFKFYRILPNGSEENYFTITLKNATIVEMKPSMLNHFDPNLAKYDHMEDVSFTYAQIEWRWEPDGIASMDKSVA
jgi:type VI secretion system secreted protein Hcp